MSSWLGTSVLSLGEFFIKKMPLVSYIYSASKQISAAIRPGMCFSVFGSWLVALSGFRKVPYDISLQIRTLMPSRKWPSSGTPVLVNMQLDLLHPQLFFKQVRVKKNSAVFMCPPITSTLEIYFSSVQMILYGPICLFEKE